MGVAIISHETSVIVAKEAKEGTKIYTFDDYLADEGKTPTLEEEVTETKKKTNTQLAIALGVIFGLIGLGIIGFIGFSIWKKK